MKKTLSLFVAVLLVLGMMSMGISANRGLSYTAQYATPVIDGVIDDCWMTVADDWTYVDLPFGSAESVCSARVKVLHDDQYIYFIAECTDATLCAQELGDALEFYLDEDNCDEEGAYCDVSIQLNLQLNGEAYKNPASASAAEADSVVAYKMTTSDNGYILEWAYAPLSGAPVAGTVMGMEFMYNDCDEDGNFINALRWNVDTANGDTPPYVQPYDFGDLILAAAPVVAEEPAADEPTVDDAPAADTTPVTADAGIVVAAVVMAAAAAVVLKKH